MRLRLLTFALLGLTSLTAQIRVNVGGPQYTDTSGNLWSADTNCTSDSTYTYNGQIHGTLNPTLYQTGRTSTSSLSCTFTVPINAYYAVTLKFAEYQPTVNPANPRLMNIFINGVRYYTAYDVRAACGFASACDISPNPIPINSSSSGVISIVITQQSGRPMLSALEIDATSANPVPSSQIITTQNYPGASVRTVQSKLNDIIDLRDFGGLCNGSADNNAPLQAAANAVASINGGQINLPSGNCTTTGELLLDNDTIVNGTGGMQFAAGQTTITRTGNSASPVIGPRDHTTDRVGIQLQNLAIEGGAHASPVVDWYRISSGKISQVGISGSAAGANGIQVDGLGGQAFFNVFSQVNLDSLPGCGMLFQNDANGNQIFGGRAIWSGAATTTCAGLKFTTSSAGNTVYGFDVESTGTPKIPAAYILDAPQTAFYGVHAEQSLIGFQVNDTATASVFNGTSFASTVTTPVNCQTPIVCGLSNSRELFNSASTWDDSLGYFRSYGSSFSGGSSHFYSLLPQTNTSTLSYNWGYDANTSGLNRFNFYNYHTLKASVDFTLGAWTGDGDGSFHGGVSGFFRNSATEHHILTQGWSHDVVYAGGGTASSFDNLLQSGSANSVMNWFLNTNTSGTKQFNIYKGDGTNTLMFQVDPATGGITTSGGGVGISNAWCSLFVHGLCITAGSAPVTTFNTRTGAVTLTSGDVTTALGFTPANAASNTDSAVTGVTVATTCSGATSMSLVCSSVVTDGGHIHGQN